MDAINMKIFIDSARLDEIEHTYSYSIISGVTTNPSLLKILVHYKTKKGMMKFTDYIVPELAD